MAGFPLFSVRGVQGGAAAHHEEGAPRLAIAAVQYVEVVLPVQTYIYC